MARRGGVYHTLPGGEVVHEDDLKKRPRFKQGKATVPESAGLSESMPAADEIMRRLEKHAFLLAREIEGNGAGWDRSFVERMLEAERKGKDRTTVKDALETLLESKKKNDYSAIVEEEVNL